MNIKVSMKKTEQRREEYKILLLNELLKCVNDICDRLEIQYAALGELLSLQLDGIGSDMDNYDYKIALIGNDYHKLIEELEEKYRVSQNDITFDIKNYFNYVTDHPVLIAKRSFPEEVGSKDVKVRLHIVQLSYLPEDRQERESYYSKASEGYKAMHAHISWNNEVLSKLVKRKKIDLDQIKISEKLGRQKALTTKYDQTALAGKIEQYIGPVIKVEDLFPVKKLSFLDSYLMLPANQDQFTSLTAAQLNNALQEKRLKLLSSFHKFCEENQLQYFAAKELLIQIMTDGKFPSDHAAVWSIGMMREDYEKAVPLLKNSQKSMGMHLLEQDERFPNIPSMVKKVIMEDDLTFSVNGKTASIEILPYDRLTSHYEESFVYKNKIRGLLFLYHHLVKMNQGMKVLSGRHWSIKDNLKKIRKFEMLYQKDTAAAKVFQGETEIDKNIPINEIFPLQKYEWRGNWISIPQNPYIWADNKDDGYTEYLAAGKTQVLKILDQICKDQGITYFATADLLVGACAYHDTIPCGGMKSFPIGLLREDYENLLTYLREHGTEYGVQLNEFRDDAKKYPLITKHVTLTGHGDWLMMIRLHPYDKVPTSFFTRRAFLDQIRGLNAEYEELINFKVNTIGKYKEIYTKEELRQLRVKYNKMDALELAKQIDTLARKYNDDARYSRCQRIAFAYSSKSVKTDCDYQTSTVRFRDMDLECPADISPWYQPMNEKISYQVQILQRENRKLLKEFDRVCNEMGIGYFICAGTLLGYIRSGGFIPWDDDVDIGMLREDYDKLLAHGQEYFSEEYFLQTRESDPNIPYVYSKLRLNHTEYYTDYTSDLNIHKGIGIDIFPFDYLPNEAKQRKKFIREVKGILRNHTVIGINEHLEKVKPSSESEDGWNEDEQKTVIEEYWRKSLKDFQQAYLDKVTENNADAIENNLKTVASFVISYTDINIEDLLPYQRDNFDGIEVNLPKYPHALMHMQYGNYMELPPIHQRVPHNVVKWSVGGDGSERQK